MQIRLISKFGHYVVWSGLENFTKINEFESWDNKCTHCKMEFVLRRNRGIVDRISDWYTIKMYERLQIPKLLNGELLLWTGDATTLGYIRLNDTGYNEYSVCLPARIPIDRGYEEYLHENRKQYLCKRFDVLR